MLRFVHKFWKNDGGAVAPTIALALFALIAIGGIAFDYARMAGLDTELQNAADQAALAAAGQLDGATNARQRATSAAQSLVANVTRFANDGGGRAIAVPTITFYQSYDDATETRGALATSDANAHYVEVTVAARVARYALTPIVAALNSGSMTASAFAGLGSAICNTPPVMMCNPVEPLANTDVNYPFDASANRGVGLRLLIGSADTPGNFGFLETGFGNGASNLARALGFNSIPGACVSTLTITTKPGLNASVMDAMNTRFDMYANGNSTCPSGGTCSPSVNVRKDLVHGNGNNNCTTSGNNGWQVSNNPYLPASNAPIGAPYPNIMGHPRDICHAVSVSGVCNRGQVGDGVWDRNAYFRVNYNWNNAATWQSNTGLPANATRYEVYNWEIAHPSYLAGNQTTQGALHGNAAPICQTPGITPSATVVDRRRMSVAVVNCRASQINGSASVPVLENLDVFLVEPSFPRARTNSTDVYVEVIGLTGSGSNGTNGGQFVRRDVPRLIR